jgi:hypothetical protein
MRKTFSSKGLGIMKKQYHTFKCSTTDNTLGRSRSKEKPVPRTKVEIDTQCTGTEEANKKTQQ